MSKKIISVLLAVVMVLAMGTVALVSVSADLADLPEVADGCNRYYFYLPENWKNDYAYTAGIYWWEGTDAHGAWPGIEAVPGDIDGVYYYDVPQDVTSIIWNNFLDGGTDPTLPIYTAAIQTVNIGTEYYDPGESDNYPEGTDSFDGMIYVTDFDKIDVNPYSGKMTVGGEWYYYYGNGEYGFAPVKGEGEIFTGSHTGQETLPTDPGPSTAPASSDVTPTETEPKETEPKETEPKVTEPKETEPKETEPKVTEPKETEPGTSYDTYITVDGVSYGANIGDVITYTMDLTAARLFEDIQGQVSYDGTVLELTRHLSDDPDIADWEIEGPIACPNLTSGLIFNAGVQNVVKFNATNVSGFNFKQEKVLVTLEFTVVAAGQTSIDSVIDEMTIKGGDESYFTDGKPSVTEGISLIEAIDAEKAEPGTTEPKETEPKVTEPKETEPKVTEPKETEPKVTEPKETEPKVTEPKETEPKVTEPKETEPKVTEPKETEPKATEPGADEPVVTEPAATTSVPAPNTTDATGATGNAGTAGDAVDTGAAAYIYVAIAILTMAACAVVVLRKKVNG